jgi:hypothetical protein
MIRLTVGGLMALLVVLIINLSIVIRSVLIDTFDGAKPRFSNRGKSAAQY